MLCCHTTIINIKKTKLCLVCTTCCKPGLANKKQFSALYYVFYCFHIPGNCFRKRTYRIFWMFITLTSEYKYINSPFVNFKPIFKRFWRAGLCGTGERGPTAPPHACEGRALAPVLKLKTEVFSNMPNTIYPHLHTVTTDSNILLTKWLMLSLRLSRSSVYF